MQEFSELKLPIMSRFCRNCGGMMEIVRHEARGDSHQAHAKCSSCGREAAVGWSRFTVPESGEGIGSVWGPLSTRHEDGQLEVSLYSDLPPDVLREKDKQAEIEARRAVEIRDAMGRFTARVEEKGLDYLFQQLKWSVFLPLGTRLKLKIGAYGFGQRTHPSATDYVPTNMRFKFAGPTAERPVEALIVVNDSQPKLEHLLSLPQTAMEPMTYAVRAVPGMMEFGTEASIVHLGTLRALTPRSHRSVLRSGEEASWQILHMKSPIEVAYARTKIDGTVVDVGAAGTAVRQLEHSLDRFSRIESGSRESAELERIYRR